MRFLLSLTVAAAAVTAQSPLTTTFANNNGGLTGGAVYFDLECLDPAGITITDLDLNFGSTAGTAGSIDVYLKPNTWAPHTDPWIGPIATGAVAASSAPGTPTNVVLSTPLSLGAGCKFGVAIVANGLSHAYTTATTLPATYATAELELTVGGGSNAPFSGAAFSPRLVNTSIYYTSGGTCPDIALVSEEGAGCVAQYASFYEEMAPTAFDLSGMELVGTPNGAGGFDVTLQPGTIDPVGTIDPTAVPLVLGDDVSLAVGTLGMEVFSNGQVAFGPGNSTNWSPSVGAMLGNPSTALYCWSDYSPNLAGSGPVVYEEDALSGQVQVTYDGVYMFGTSDPTTVQYRIDNAGGGWVISFGTMATTGPENFLVGYSVGGPSGDPGPTDLSTLGVLSTAGSDTLPLSLTAIGRPVQGAAAVNFDVTTGNIPASALSHMGIVGLTSPGLPLDSIGMPGCFLNASADVLTFSFPVSTPDFTWTALSIPAGPVFFSGFQFSVQSAIFGTSANSFLGLGALTSNGLTCTIGTL
ncbi:MAG TPA: hypothetical protein ENI87_07465 [bacterium]|nr:hypothetical protein [bacterium]